MGRQSGVLGSGEYNKMHVALRKAFLNINNGAFSKRHKQASY